VPADGVVAGGEAAIRTALLTGEAEPVPVRAGQKVWAGTVVVDGALTVEVTQAAEETVIHRMAEELRTAADRGTRPSSTDRIAPWFTGVTLVVAALTFGGWWWAVLLGIAGLLFLWNRLYANPPSRLAIDRILIQIPVVGRLIRDVAVSRFTRTLGTLVGSGLPVLQALRITKATLGNRALQAHIDVVADEVGSGATIADPLERSGQFPPLLVQIVGMGERTGKLDEMLLQAADAFEQRTEQAIKLFTQILPPLLICGLAVIVGFVLLAILLPLLELQESIGV